MNTSEYLEGNVLTDLKPQRIKNNKLRPCQ